MNWVSTSDLGGDAYKRADFGRRKFSQPNKKIKYLILCISTCRSECVFKNQIKSNKLFLFYA